MKLIVGLGNPGRKYVDTRHNIGWTILADLAEKYGTSQPKEKFHGEIVDADLNGIRALLLAPHTFMNRSGQSVVAARDFYKIPDDEILVICDDFNLPLAKIRLRATGTSGGQKGLADIIKSLGTENVTRLRVGVGEPPANWDPAEYVLSKFKKQEQDEIKIAVGLAADAVALWAKDGTDTCMNRFN